MVIRLISRFRLIIVLGILALVVLPTGILADHNPVLLSPNSGNQGQTLYVAIDGTGFNDSSAGGGWTQTATFSGSGITVVNLLRTSDTQLAATISVAVDATPGLRDVSIEQCSVATAACDTLTITGAFTVLEGPLESTITAAALALATAANGDFETGDLAGWTVVNEADGSGDWFNYTGATSPLSGFPIAFPPEGTYAAVSDQFGPGSHLLFQDIVLEPGCRQNLSFILYYENRAGGFVSPTTLSYSGGANQQYRVDIIDPAAPVDTLGVLASIFQTQAGDPLSMAPTLMTFDLTPFAGTTVRLRFAEVDNLSWFQASVDDVKIETNCVRSVGGATSFLADDSGSAMGVIIGSSAAIAIALAGTGVWYNRRRRQAQSS